VKVSSKVVYGGYLLKKGELNTTPQLRWFILSDEGVDYSMLRYYDGRNAVSRVMKGEIKISANDVQTVRHYMHEGQGQRALAVRIVTSTRTWELISPRGTEEARRWTELLNARIRRRPNERSNFGHRPSMAASELQVAASTGVAATGTIPETTRL